MALPPTHQQTQALLDALYESYQQTKTFHPVDTATLLIEMFRVQRALAEEARGEIPLTPDERDTLTQTLINLSRVAGADETVLDVLSDMNRLV